MKFANRREAGRELARHLKTYAGRRHVQVLALPRGGVPVAFEVAQALGLPLDVFLVRKLGVPDQPELAMGAIGSGGVRVLNESVIKALRISEDEIDEVAAKEQAEIDRQERAYRNGHCRRDIENETVILIDDGLATGATMRAAVEALRRHGAARIVVAVPVGAAETCANMWRIADEATCARTPEPFFAVGQWYDDFSQTTDEEVQKLLAEAEDLSSSAVEPQSVVY